MVDDSINTRNTSLLNAFIKKFFFFLNHFVNNPKHLIFSSAIILIVFSNQFQQKPISEEYNLYPPLVVGVADWRYEGGERQNIQQNIYNTLVNRLDDLSLKNVAAVQIPVALDNANDVDRVAAEFGVDVIVWGWYDEVGVRGFVDLADATQEDGLTNSLDVFLKRGGSTEAIRVLKVLSEFAYIEDGVVFCVPRWTP
jgi:hypothetical protein